MNTKNLLKNIISKLLMAKAYTLKLSKVEGESRK